LQAIIFKKFAYIEQPTIS